MAIADVFTGKKSVRKVQFYYYFNPLITALQGLGGSGKPDEVAERIAQDLGLSDDVLNELLPSGAESRYRNQIHWARYYLVRAGLIDSSKRGIWSLTESGRNRILTLDESRDLAQKIRSEDQDRRHLKSNSAEHPSGKALEPVDNLTEDHRPKVLDLLLRLPPDGFERLAQRILREAGFSQVRVTGRSGDGGIDGDGILQINALVSLKVLFQCKRYQGSVAASQIRDFRGAMSGRSDKGILLTTGTFTQDARREASRDGVPSIELIDGEKLVDMLEQLQLGLRQVTAYEIDTLFFDEFRNSTQ